MPRAIEPCGFMRKPILKIRPQFNMLALAISICSLGLLVTTAYPQSASVVREQEAPSVAKAHEDYTTRTVVVDGARLPDLSSLDILPLIHESDRLGAAMHSRLPEYTYIQTRLSREVNQRGKLIERVAAYEAYPIKVLGHHRHIISLISQNGAPVSPKRLKKEREQAAKEIEEAERDSAFQASGATAPRAERYISAGIGVSQNGDGVWVGVSQFLRHCRFSAPRYDRLAGRDMIALNIRKCDGNPSVPGERYLAGMAGVVWIDVEDKVVARLEAWPSTATEQELPSAPPNAETIVYEQTRLADGLWAPKRIRLNAIGKPSLFNGTDKDMTFEFSQYQRFNTDADDLQQVTLISKP